MTHRPMSWRRTLNANVDVILRLLRFAGSVFVGLREGVCGICQSDSERVLYEGIIRNDLGAALMFATASSVIAWAMQGCGKGV